MEIKTTVSSGIIFDRSRIIVLYLASEEDIWLRKLIENIGIKQSDATALYEGNQGTMALAKNL